MPGGDTSATRAVRRSLSSSLSRLARVMPTTSPPDTSSAVASRAESASSSRARRVTCPGARSARLGAQGVAEPAHGPDQLVVAGVELAAQVADVRLDDVVVTVEVV